MNKNSIKQKFKAFTLTELLVVIALVMVLSAISVPIYNSHTREVAIAEGYALLGRIRTGQETYYTEYGCFLSGQYYTNNDDVLGINARRNKFFQSFSVNWNLGASSKEFQSRVVSMSPRITMICNYSLTSGVNINFA